MTETKHWNAAVCIGAGALFGAVITALVFNALSADAGDWLSFAGSIVGGGMTLVAGWIAWTAAQQQMAETRRPELERGRRAMTFLRKYAADWTDAMHIVNEYTKEINIDDIYNTNRAIDYEIDVLDIIKRECDVASGYISPDLIHRITDYIDPDAYIAFVDLNGAVADLLRIQGECRSQITQGFKSSDGQVFGSQYLGEQFEHLVEIASLCAEQAHALKQALSKAD